MENSDKLGKYHIEGVLGEGGMGIVYKGRDPSLDRVVAIKTIRKSLLEGKSGNELRRRFRREAQAEGRLVHPNIIAIYEYQEDADGMPFFVMEYVEGKSLKEYIARGMHFSLDKSVLIVEQILSALSYSHSKGIIHRDIKPANIILLEDDSIKIADFGISKIEGSEFTQTGQVMGTPHYISPEQRIGKRTDGRSDLYSVGAVFYELITGIKALPGASFGDLTPGGDKEETPTKLDSRDPATVRVYKRVVLRALKKDPEQRFQDAEEFAQALKESFVPLKAKGRDQAKWLVWGGVLGAMLLAGALLYPDLGTEGPKLGPTGKVIRPPAEPLSGDDREKIAKQLKVAEMHELIGRLILPDGSSAYHAFDMVLDIDPQNAQALAGLESVRDQVIEKIESALANGQLEDAQTQLEVALLRFPGNEKLQDLQNQLGSK